MRTTTAATDGLRKGMLAILGLATALPLLSGCGAAISSGSEEDVYASELRSRRLPGSSAIVFMHSQKALRKLGFNIVSVRENEAINARLDHPDKPIQAYLKIRGDEKLDIMLYNLDDEEQRIWRKRLFKKIEESIEG